MYIFNIMRLNQIKKIYKINNAIVCINPIIILDKIINNIIY